MSILKYKTRGGSSPNKKQKIYYSAHEKDFKIYFNEITKEILSKYDVTIWYRDIENEINIYNEQEYLSDLSQMNLLIIPVTSRLLTTPNYALDKEYKYAIEKHIPVLPIMVEEGLVDLFNEKFGEIQFLDKTSKDITVISYEEKLRKYLDSIIIGDEITKKIKDAFDSYIFLSYRKKDRIYAQELMKLIHSNEKFRNVAIWYDEFLTPGENFNNEIKEALNKSDLFTLVVTPNLVNEINYVMTTEYPEAKKAGKKIIPAELVKTDKKELTSKYPEIPEVIDGRDINVVSENIIKNLKDDVSFKKETDSEHLYLIGLAYLVGVDVEINYELSEKLLIAAANDNQVEAIEKLILMYHNGEAVKRNYIEEIKWIEKLIEVRKNKYEETGLEEDAIKFFWENIYLGNAYYNIHKFDKAKEIYLEALRISVKQTEKYNTISSKRNITICYEKLGLNELELGNLEKAREYCLKNLEITGQIKEKSNTLESRRDLAASNNNLGHIELDLGNLEKAKEYCFKSLEILKQIDKEVNTLKSRRDLAGSYLNLGNIEQELGNLDKSKEYSLNSLEIFKQIDGEINTFESRRNLALNYNNLGSLELDLNNLDKARECLIKALEIRKQISEETGTINSRADLSISYYCLSIAEEKSGNLNESQKYSLNSLEITKQIYEETNTLKSKIKLSEAYNDLGVVEAKIGNLNNAKNYFQKSLELDKSLLEKTNSLEYKIKILKNYDNLALVETKQNNLIQARYYYLKSLEIIQQISEETGTIGSEMDLSKSYNNLGFVENKLGNLNNAKEYYLKSLALNELINEEINTPELRRNLSINYDRLGDIEQKLDNLNNAKVYYLKLSENINSLYKETNSKEDRDYLIFAYWSLFKTTKGIKYFFKKCGYILKIITILIKYLFRKK